ncbi:MULTISPECIES: hypothetical protein [Cysteiniphilum]|uniref:hypothetical protein n=1 Tax=Cysteiniphilum TaxID=2056696 RepID=UPI001783F003|nr:MULTISPECIES: hypothetical protein [Cysteiniphilum]
MITWIVNILILSTGVFLNAAYALEAKDQKYNLNLKVNTYQKVLQFIGYSPNNFINFSQYPSRERLLVDFAYNVKGKEGKKISSAIRKHLQDTVNSSIDELADHHLLELSQGNIETKAREFINAYPYSMKYKIQIKGSTDQILRFWQQVAVFKDSTASQSKILLLHKKKIHYSLVITKYISHEVVTDLLDILEACPTDSVYELDEIDLNQAFRLSPIDVVDFYQEPQHAKAFELLSQQCLYARIKTPEYVSAKKISCFKSMCIRSFLEVAADITKPEDKSQLCSLVSDDNAYLILLVKKVLNRGLKLNNVKIANNIYYRQFEREDIWGQSILSQKAIDFLKQLYQQRPEVRKLIANVEAQAQAMRKQALSDGLVVYFPE